ncbi:MAG: RHS repeat-associated core domain-containing protein [Nanoarchaeota archaeon]|nr:RHS repeat-associated core domain-containing protein [Nanoarchaeota archaeon]
MHFGAKSRIAIFLLVILLFSFFVYAKGISNLDYIEQEGPKEIEDIEVVVEEISPIDLWIEKIYFEDELIAKEELDLIVEIGSNYLEEVEVEVKIEIKEIREGENDFEKDKFMFEYKKEIKFAKKEKLIFGPIIFDKPGEYDIIATIESSVKEKDKKNNEISGLFFFPFLSCEDGTYHDECNKDLLFCDNGELVANCGKCGCEEGLVCVSDECVEREYDEGMLGTKTFFYVGRKLVAQEKDDEFSYYHHDNLGSVRKITDENGSVVSSFEYFPFGEKYSQEGESDFEYTGQKFDSTGLNYYGARYYDSSLGRFITSDPGHDGVNWYAYVGNNPVTRVDPNGLEDYDVKLKYKALGFSSPREEGISYTYSEGIGIKYDSVKGEYLDNANDAGWKSSYIQTLPDGFFTGVGACIGIGLGTFKSHIDTLEREIMENANNEFNVGSSSSGGNIIATGLSPEAKSKIDLWYAVSGVPLMEDWQKVYMHYTLFVIVRVPDFINGLEDFPVPDPVTWVTGILFPHRIHGFSMVHCDLNGAELIRETRQLTADKLAGNNPDPFAWSGVVLPGGRMDRELNPHAYSWPDLEDQRSERTVSAELMYLN